MMRLILIIAAVITLSGCSAHNPIETANAIRGLQGLTKAGVTESATNCIKDIFDPANRGSGC